MTIVLGVDLATSNARVLAVDLESGEHLAQHSLPLSVLEYDGYREQEPNYGDLVRSLLRSVVADLGARSAEIVALSTTGTSGTVVPADRLGRPTGRALLYNDPRGTAAQSKLNERGHGGRPTGALARAAWMHAHRPAERYVFTPDVVASNLAGVAVASDTSHALKSGIDPVAGTWDSEALKAVGVPRETLSRLVHPGRVMATIARETADELGLPVGVQIVSGMTDGCTAQLATGASTLGDTVGVLGTTLVLKAIASQEITENGRGIYSHVAPDGLFWAGGASNTGAGVLSVGIPASYDPISLNEAIGAAGPSRYVSYPLARPGERFPVHSPTFAGFSVGLDRRPSVPSDPLLRLRATFEGVAFVERLGLESLASLGAPSRRHYLSGGASVSRVWGTIRASALGREVTVPSNASSALGAAMLAASALGKENFSSVVQRLRPHATTIDPDPQLTDELESRFALFAAEVARQTASSGAS